MKRRTGQGLSLMWVQRQATGSAFELQTKRGLKGKTPIYWKKGHKSKTIISLLGIKDKPLKGRQGFIQLGEGRKETWFNRLEAAYTLIEGWPFLMNYDRRELVLQFLPARHGEFHIHREREVLVAHQNHHSDFVSSHKNLIRARN